MDQLSSRLRVRAGVSLTRIDTRPSRTEKWAYVLANPVRAGLIADASAWPYVKTWPLR